MKPHRYRIRFPSDNLARVEQGVARVVGIDIISEAGGACLANA